jgi:uncharacterized RDD family membrane protein YckC
MRAVKTLHLPRQVTPEALNVAPALVGAPLAQPQRRAWAMGLDLLVVALLSGISGLWLLGAMAVLVWQLRSRRLAWSARRQWVGWAAVAVMGLLVLQGLAGGWHGRARAEADGPRETTAELEAPDDPASAPSDAQRIARLEAQLAKARAPRGWRAQLDEIVDAFGLSFGWGIVYFSLLPAWWGGQTLGKKLLRLRVVELTGKPMTPMLGLKRYGGYAAGMATGGIGFAQVLWDANRQALHDKAAHTVVLDLRAPAAPPEAGA